VNKGRTLEIMGKNKDALACYQEGLRLNPRNKVLTEKEKALKEKMAK
jgi:hypothetical protein